MKAKKLKDKISQIIKSKINSSDESDGTGGLDTDDIEGKILETINEELDLIEQERISLETKKQDEKIRGILSEKGLHSEYSKFVFDLNDDVVNERVESLIKIQSEIESDIKKRIAKDNSYIPPQEEFGSKTSSSFINVIKENQVKRN